MKFSSSISALFVLLPLLSQVAGVAVSDDALVARQNRGGQGGQGGRGAAAAAAAKAAASKAAAAKAAGAKGNGGNNGAAAAAAAASASAASAAAAAATAAAGKGGNNNGAAAAAAAAASASAASAAAAAATAAAGKGGNNAANNGGAAANNGDPQKSLTLDPKVIAPAFANDGQDVPTAGQVPSLTSTNNFINFCLTVPNLPITNGQQITSGSCNPAPIGVIPSTANMPSAKFAFPTNGGAVTANQAFTVNLNAKNIQLGNFVNAKENYFAAPQTLNGQGQIIGHTHIVIEQLTSLTQTTPTDPNKFAFFKGVDDAAQNGAVQVPVTAGVPAGAYRICTINSSSNHQPVIVPIAQHGSLDDCVYFSATANGQAAGGAAANNGTANAGAAAGNAAGNANTGKGANNGAAAATTAAAGAAATTAAAGGKTGGGKGAAAAAAAAKAKAAAAAAAAKGGRGRGQRRAHLSRA